MIKTLCMATLLLTMPAIPEASAHARLLKSDPAKSATLTKSPEQIDLWYNELLDDGFNTVEVYPSGELGRNSHTNRVLDKPRVDPKDRTHLTARLQDLPPGDYVLDWRVLSRDGHTAPGRLTFRVTGK